MALGRKPLEIIKDGNHHLLCKAEHWQRIFLKEIAKVQNGFAFNSSNFVKDGGLPLIRIRDIDKTTTVDRYKGDYSNDFLVKKGDILVGMDGDFKASYWKGETALLNQRVCRIIPSSDKFDSKFLFLCLQPYLNAINEETSSVTVKHLSSKTVEEIPLPYPTLPEQKAIVARVEELFSELDNGSAQLKTAQQQLNVYRQSLLKWAFEGRLTNKKVKEGELPEGWKWVKVADITNVVRGGSPRPAGDPKFYDGKIPFLKVRDITKDNGMYLSTFEYTIKESGLHKTRQITPNTLLLSNSGATLGVPKICMIDATMNDGIAAFLDLDKRSLKYLYYFWLSKTKELRNINMGAAQPNLNTDIIRSYLVPYCSFEEQQLIVSELESKLTVCDKIEETIQQSLQQAETLRQSILKQAFEGKLVKSANMLAD